MIRAAALSTLKIVTVAHDPTLRQCLRENLDGPCGHQVIAEAGTGTDLVRAALTLEPDVVVFDLNLPGCNGLDALRQVYQERPVAAVALATCRDEDLLRRALSDYYLVYLVKPLDPRQLGPAVSAAWSRFETSRQLADENASLRRSLENRKLIERAKGVLMKRHHWSEADAYRRLQRGAMNRRTTMAFLAQSLLEGKPLDL